MRYAHTMRGRRGTVTGAVLGAGLALLSAATGVRAASAWTSPPALVAQLGPEVKITVPGIGTYGVRPPRGFTLRRVNMTAVQGGSLVYMWTGPMQPDRTAATFLVTVGSDNSGMMPGMTSTSFVQLEMSAATRTHRNAQISAMQQGTVHGLPFARASWTGIGPRTGKMFAGIFYGEFVRPQAIMIAGKDEAPSSRTSIPLFNAAALTLHKL